MEQPAVINGASDVPVEVEMIVKQRCGLVSLA